MTEVEGVLVDRTEQQAAAREKLVKYYETDALGENTRKSRKMLILTCGIVLAMVWVEIIPKEISAIGVSFSETDQRVLLLGGGVVVTYFLITFWVQAVTDNLARKLSWNDAEQSMDAAGLSLKDMIIEIEKGGRKVPNQAAKLEWPMDYYFPIALGFITLVSCIFYVWGLDPPADHLWLRS